MSRTLFQEIFPYFSNVFNNYGFKAEEHQESLSFGNEQLIFSSEHLLLKFINDRGEIHVDVASKYASHKWFLLGYVLEFIEGKEVCSYTNNQIRLSTASHWLQKDFQKVVEIFNQENVFNTIKILETFVQEKAKSRFGKNFRSGSQWKTSK